MFCNKCGKPVTDSMAFCPNCGTAIIKETVIKDAPMKEETTVETVAQKPEKYKLVIVQTKNKLKLVELLQRNFGLSLSNARQMAKTFPIVLSTGLDKEDAEEAANSLINTGIAAIIEKEADEDCSTPTPLQEKEKEEEKTTEKTENQPDKNEKNAPLSKEQKVKIYSILKLISASAAMLAVIFFIFLPLFYYTKTTSVEGESVKERVSISLFTICYDAISEIITGNTSGALFSAIFSYIKILIVLLAIPLAVTAVKNFIKKLTIVVRLKKNLDSASQNSAMAAIEATTKKDSFETGKSLLLELVLLYFISGYSGILIGSIITIGLLLIIETICSKLADGYNH